MKTQSEPEKVKLKINYTMLAMILCFSLAACKKAIVEWTAPLTRTDGSALLLSEINHFTIYKNGIQVATASLEKTSTEISWTSIGDEICVSATDTDNIESEKNCTTLQ